ncbi:MAG: UbiA family prenyltransferase [Candidatus Hadarchaeales archaeon]
MIDPLRFYRVRGWGRKLPFTRFLGYPLLGMAVGPKGALPSFPFLLFLVDGLVVSSILAFSYALNDYFDFVLEGESNYVGECLKSGRLSHRKTLFLILLPLFFFPLSLLLPFPVFLLLFLFLGLSSLYSLPRVRMDRRPLPKFLLSPFSAFILTLQALLLSNNLSSLCLGLLLVVFLFHYYANSFHYLEEGGEWKDCLRFFPLLSFSFSLLLSFFLSPLFLLTASFSLLRYSGVRKGDFFAMRSKLFGPPLFSEEFLVYAFLGMMGIL